MESRDQAYDILPPAKDPAPEDPAPLVYSAGTSTAGASDTRAGRDRVTEPSKARSPTDDDTIPDHLD